jgi:hypothetical protein
MLNVKLWLAAFIDAGFMFVLECCVGGLLCICMGKVLQLVMFDGCGLALQKFVCW